jgi:hypothetical protein
MPKVEKRKARTDIFERGIKIPDSKTKSGYRRDKSQPHPEGDTKLVEKGQTYYTWSFRFGGTHISLTPPKASQLTQSAFKSTLCDIEERIGAIDGDDPGALQSERDEIVSDLESLRDETQGSLDNMPEGLQQGDTGQLQERIDALEGAISEFEGVDLDYEEPDDEEIRHDLEADLDTTAEEGEDGVTDDEIEEERHVRLQDWLQEKIDELQAISIDAS